MAAPAKNFSAAEGGRKIFLRTPPGVGPPLVPKPVPTYVYLSIIHMPKLKVELLSYRGKQKISSGGQVPRDDPKKFAGRLRRPENFSASAVAPGYKLQIFFHLWVTHGSIPGNFSQKNFAGGAYSPLGTIEYFSTHRSPMG